MILDTEAPKCAVIITRRLSLALLTVSGRPKVVDSVSAEGESSGLWADSVHNCQPDHEISLGRKSSKTSK